MDNLTRSQRTKCMARIRSKNTKPEIIVRKILTKLGHRYRLHSATLPGKPDIIINKRKIIIFINGCFWHQHPECKRQSLPKTNIEYWHVKLLRNIERQHESIGELKSMGWNVIIIWECETKSETNLINKLQGYLSV